MHTVLYGETGQTLRHVPSERVTAASYVIQDLTYDVDDSAGTLASGAATVDDLDLTTDGAAGISESDARAIPVASTTGAAAGDPIVIVAASGDWEHARIRGVVDGVSLTLEQPLIGNYPSGSSVYGVQVSAPFPDASAADEDLVIEGTPLRVVWEYTIGGALRKVQEPIYVRRQRDGSAYEAAAIERVRNAYPDLAEMTPHHGDMQRWASFCAEDLRVKLLARGIQPGQFLTGEQGVQALAYRIVLHCAENGLSPGTVDVDSFHETVRRHFETAFGSLTTGSPGAGTVEVLRDTEQEIPVSEYRSPWGAD